MEQQNEEGFETEVLFREGFPCKKEENPDFVFFCKGVGNTIGFYKIQINYDDIYKSQYSHYEGSFKELLDHPNNFSIRKYNCITPNFVNSAFNMSRYFHYEQSYIDIKVNEIKTKKLYIPFRDSCLTKLRIDNIKLGLFRRIEQMKLEHDSNKIDDFISTIGISTIVVVCLISLIAYAHRVVL